MHLLEPGVWPASATGKHFRILHDLPYPEGE
jgi:hypothetical protein